MLIKVLQDGLLNEAEAEPKTYTENEFIVKYGTYAYDEISDYYFDFHEDEKDTNGCIRFWLCGLHVEICGD